MKATGATIRQSRLPEAIGKMATDAPSIFAYVNQATQQLINAMGESGAWLGWQKVVFSVNALTPYITLPRQFARAINLDVCRKPIRIQNEFYEFLEDGIGLQDFYQNAGWKHRDWHGILEGYDRGSFPTMTDLTPTNQLLRVFITDPRDVGKRILIGPSQDQNGNFIYSQDGNQSVNGFYISFSQPFTTTNFSVSNIGGIQIDQTFGDVELFQVDETTGAQVLLARYQPGERLPQYRRYYISKLPRGCCPIANPCLNTTGVQTAPPNVGVTAMVKLEFIPITRDTDFNVIGNIPALIEECKAIRYSDMDKPEAMALEAKSHSKAMKYLNQELKHYLGALNPAVNLAVYGSARLEKQQIGQML